MAWKCFCVCELFLPCTSMWCAKCNCRRIVWFPAAVAVVAMDAETTSTCVWNFGAQFLRTPPGGLMYNTGFHYSLPHSQCSVLAQLSPDFSYRDYICRDLNPKILLCGCCILKSLASVLWIQGRFLFRKVYPKFWEEKLVWNHLCIFLLLFFFFFSFLVSSAHLNLHSCEIFAPPPEY